VLIYRFQNGDRKPDTTGNEHSHLNRDDTISVSLRAMWKMAIPYDGKNADFNVPMDKGTETLIAKRAAFVHKIEEHG
jgi:hypothetical protein